jgi:hypothetical protein
LAEDCPIVQDDDLILFPQFIDATDGIEVLGVDGCELVVVLDAVLEGLEEDGKLMQSPCG